MLTLEDLKTMPAGIFDSGIETLHYQDTTQECFWIASRGDIHDWAIYALPLVRKLEFPSTEEFKQYIKNYGNKVLYRQEVKKLIPATPEAYAMYRY